MPSDVFHPKFGNAVAIPFKVANAVTAQTAVDLSMDGGNTLAVALHGGSVVGIGVVTNADITAGTIAFSPHKAGTEFAQSGFPNPTLSSAVGVSAASYASVRPGVCTFSDGDTLGVSYTSSTDMAPSSTNDFDVLLYVVYNADGA